MKKFVLMSALLAGLILAGCAGGGSTTTPSSPPPSTTTTAPPTSTTAAIDAAAIFAANCSPCHGANRQGGVGPELTAAALQSRGRTDQYIIDTITNGRGGMPSWRNRLSQAQIEALLRFLRS